MHLHILGNPSLRLAHKWQRLSQNSEYKVTKEETSMAEMLVSTCSASHHLFFPIAIANVVPTALSRSLPCDNFTVHIAPSPTAQAHQQFTFTVRVSSKLPSNRGPTHLPGCCMQSDGLMHRSSSVRSLGSCHPSRCSPTSIVQVLLRQPRSSTQNS